MNPHKNRFFDRIGEIGLVKIKAALPTKAGIGLNRGTTVGTGGEGGQGSITGLALGCAVRVLVAAIGTGDHKSW